MPQLTPQQREEMRRRGYITQDGRSYWDMNSSGAAGDNPDLQNYFGGHMEVADQGPGAGADSYQGQRFNQFDASGNANRSGTIDWMADPTFADYLPYILLGAAAPFAGAALMGAGGAGALGANGAFLGEGALSGIPAWDGALTAAQAAGGASAGGAAMSGLETMGELPLMEMPAGMEASAFVPSAAMGNAINALPAAGGGLLNGASGASRLLGPLAPIAGAIAGSQGNREGASSERRMDPRLDKYVFDDLLPRTQGLLAQQMPIAQQYGQQMGQVGQGLLNTPAAGNGFGLFTRNRYGS